MRLKPVLLSLGVAVFFIGGRVEVVFSSEEGDNASAQVAGERAHFAHEFCGVSLRTISDYKLRLKAALPDVRNFDRHWERGWKQEVDRFIQYRAARSTDPHDFAHRVRADCARLNWQAKNAATPNKRGE